MRVVSFDIFDTLLTRMVALPGDLFRLAALELKERLLIAISPEEFAAARVESENMARAPHPHKETTFAEIYIALAAKLGWTDAQRDTAAEIELQTECRWIRPSEVAGRKLEAARRVAERVLFISDMYLPAPFLVSLLREHGFWKEGDELFLSGDLGCSKGMGTIFPIIRERVGGIKAWRHFGDNEHSDIRMPARHGIEVEHVSHALLTRYEQIYRPPNILDIPLWRSKAAAAIRYARLCAPESNAHLEGVWNIAASVAGPLLFGYVAWVFHEAAQRGVQRLYFISRDGEILLKIARRMIARWNYSIEARYLYGSRQAWRPGAGDGLDDWFKSWAIATGTPTTLESIFSRLQVDPTPFAEILAGGGFPKARWNEFLTDEQRDQLWNVIRDSPLRAVVVDRRLGQRQLAETYLTQEGFGDDLNIAIVDIGWFGSMHLCLDAIIGDLPARQKKPLLGFYFGMISTPDPKRMFAYWTEKPGYRPLPKTNFSFYERFCMATHGSVSGYKMEKGRAIPQLECERHDSIFAWGLETWQAAILKVTEAFLETLSNEEILLPEFFFLTRQGFDLFEKRPTLEEATVFGKLPQDQKNEVFAPTVVPDLSEWELLRAAFDYRRRLPGWWPEGTAIVKRSPSLYLYLKLKSLRNR